MGPQRLLHYKRKKKPFNLLANPRFVSGLVCVLWFVYARSKGHPAPRPRGRVGGAHVFSPNLYQHTPFKKTLTEL